MSSVSNYTTKQIDSESTNTMHDRSYDIDRKVKFPCFIRSLLCFTRLHKQGPIKVCYCAVASAVSILTAIALLQMSGMSFFTVGQVAMCIILMPLGNVMTILFYGDNGQNLQRAMKLVSLSTIKKASHTVSLLYILMLFLAVITVLAPNTPGSWYYRMSFGILFSFGFLEGMVFMFAVIIISSSSAKAIHLLQEKVILRISKHHEVDVNKINGVSERTSRKDGQDIMNLITKESDKIADEMKRSNKYLAPIVGLGCITFMLQFVTLIIVMVLNASIGINAELWEIIACVANLLTVSVLLSTTLAPSLAWTKFMYSLNRPNTLFVLSECFKGESDLNRLFKGLEQQREYMVWKVFGISVTIDVYQRVLGSLMTLLVVGGSVLIRINTNPLTSMNSVGNSTYR